MKKKREKRVYLDRIEEGVAVLLITSNDEDEEQEKQVPASALPPDAKEGDWLVEAERADSETSTTYAVDREETDSAKRRVQNLMDELAQ